MPEGLVISIDGLGGDAAPAIVADGVEIAARARPEARFLLHGPRQPLAALLAARPAARAASEIVEAERGVPMDMKPSQALRQGRGTSMWNAVAAVEEGRAHAAVSAGNTGALMAISMLRLRLMAGVDRPALVASWPTARGRSAVLDVGATIGADADQLVEFAIMGEAYFRAVFGVDRPTVALLNIGAEDQKGHEELKVAARLLREAGLDLDFRGFVEGDDISGGAVDVVVTDGFTGNIAIKTAEGVARLIARFLREALKSGPVSMLGAAIAYPALKKLSARMDPRAANGGVFLGLNGVVVKSHGGTDGAGFAVAIDLAARMAGSHFREEVARNLARLSEPAPTAPATETHQP